MVIAPVRRAGDPGSIPGPGENFSLKLLRLKRLCHIKRMQERSYQNIYFMHILYERERREGQERDGYRMWEE